MFIRITLFCNIMVIELLNHQYITYKSFGSVNQLVLVMVAKKYVFITRIRKSRDGVAKGKNT